MSENGVFPVKQRTAMDELLAHGDQVRAAAAAGVSLRSVQRWMHEPEFAAALQHAQDAALDRVTGDLVRAAGGAVALLESTINNADAALGLRLQAARTLLDAALRWRELRGIEQRLTAIEAAIGAEA